jgi:ATP-dependent exoDNAse (exonuclease V) beta subunit
LNEQPIDLDLRFMSPTNRAGTQDALAGLRKWRLERDDISDPGGRVYRDKAGTVYHSVTRILSATAPEHQQKALQRWLERPDSERDRQMAAERGTQAHAHAEYILKTARKLAANAANKRGAYREACDGLERPPSAITAWALQKAIQGAPRPAWSASGFARGLRHWIEANVTAIHAVEFSIHHPAGFAGSADGLFDVCGTLSVVDFKTTKASIHQGSDAKEARLHSYRHQLGGYSLGLRHLTGIDVPQGVIVTARRTGAPEITVLDKAQLLKAEDAFLERVGRYFLAINPPY